MTTHDLSLCRTGIIKAIHIRFDSNLTFKLAFKKYRIFLGYLILQPYITPKVCSKYKFLFKLINDIIGSIFLLERI